jgi:hypothetical protein
LNLPHREQAFIQPDKLTRYLLSENHRVGRSKAKFFRGLGFNDANVSLLEKVLLAIAYEQEVMETVTTRHGIKYVMTGVINTPSNRAVSVLTVWIVDVGEQSPRFVTARPFLVQPEGDPHD